MVEVAGGVPVLFAQGEVSFLMKFVENSIWVGIAACAGWGMYCGILLLNRIRQKKFPSQAAEQAFLNDIGESLDKRDYDRALGICDTPELWNRALPQLITLGIQNRDRPIKRIRGLLAERYDRDIVAGLDRLSAWVNTSIKTAPQLGLLGTVLGMINAFAKIAGAAASGVDPKDLAADISFALWTTAAGMAISIPLIVIAGLAANRMTLMSESIDEGLGTFLEDLDRARSSGAAA
jgi:biopolymer transport protein ExbB/TolQ